MKKVGPEEKRKKKSTTILGVGSRVMGKNLPYVFFLIFLAMLYIGNAHYTEKKVRKIEHLKTTIKELTWTYMSAKSEAIYQSTYTQLGQQVEANHLSNEGSFPKKLSATK